MSKLEELDKILGESLEQANAAARVVRQCDEIDANNNLKGIGNAIHSLWEIREEIYTINSSLKQDFVVEFESDKKRYSQLSELVVKAEKYEEEMHCSEALKIYKELLKESNYGYFKRLVESGLYRVSNKS